MRVMVTTPNGRLVLARRISRRQIASESNGFQSMRVVFTQRIAFLEYRSSRSRAMKRSASFGSSSVFGHHFDDTGLAS